MPPVLRPDRRALVYDHVNLASRQSFSVVNANTVNSGPVRHSSIKTREPAKLISLIISAPPVRLRRGRANQHLCQREPSAFTATGNVVWRLSQSNASCSTVNTSAPAVGIPCSRINVSKDLTCFNLRRRRGRSNAHTGVGQSVNQSRASGSSGRQPPNPAIRLARN